VEDIDRLLGEAKQRDEQLRDSAAGAQPAGDSDPYRVNESDESAH
jgi:hypothetical protein